MRATELTELVRRRPFTPLRLHLTTGETYDIPHPDFIWVRRQCADVVTNSDPKTGVIDRSERISLLHIVRIEDVESAAQPKNGNGEARG